MFTVRKKDDVILLKEKLKKTHSWNWKHITDKIYKTQGSQAFSGAFDCIPPPYTITFDHMTEPEQVVLLKKVMEYGQNLLKS